MEYGEYHTATESFKFEMDFYVFTNNEVDDIFYVAKTLLQDIDEKAENDIAYRKRAYKYFTDGGTLLLKEILAPTRYKDSEPKHFNALCLIDAVSCFKNNKVHPNRCKNNKVIKITPDRV